MTDDADGEEEELAERDEDEGVTPPIGRLTIPTSTTPSRRSTATNLC